MKNIVPVLFLTLIVCSNIRAQRIVPDTIETLFSKELSHFPQEKIYLQTDRGIYMSGETLWFRTHLVDALMLKQANASRYVYVELLNPVGDLVERVKIRPDSLGCFYGHIPLSEELPEGNYSLRAYTWFMQNVGKEYFFHKPIYIVTPMPEDISEINSRSKPELDEAFDVAFFPEGGHAAYSTDVKIAFKAIDTNGLSKEIVGQVFDEEDQVCANFESLHLGMGSFRMYYVPGKKYHAICTDKDGISKRFKLPEPTPDAISLNTLWTKNHLRVSLSKSPDTQPDSSLILVAHLRGIVLYAQPWDDTQSHIDFEREFFPSGIVHFLLINQNRDIVSERLVFSMQDSSLARTEIRLNKENYSSRDEVNMEVQINDANGNPISGNFSLAVVGRSDVIPDTLSNIVSTLLLTSELKGHIEAPLSYLQGTRSSAFALDLLMMTQGWRRYNIPEVLKGNTTRTLDYDVELSDEVSGTVERVFTTLKEGNISLIALKDSVIGTEITQPDQKGRFTFSGLEYPHGTQYIVQALTKKGSSKVFIEIDPRKSFPLTSGLPVIQRKHKPHIEDNYIAKMDQKYTIENGMRIVNLAEVVVTANKKKGVKTESPFYSVATSKVLTEEDVEEGHFISVYDLLRRLPGITVTGGDVKYRGATPMLLLDNVPEEGFDYSNLDVSDIKEAFFSPPATVGPLFGAAASNGAVVINTKRGFVQKNKMNNNIRIVSPIGYQQTVEFYSPMYNTKYKKDSTIPDLRTTIYWNPNVQIDSSGKASVDFYTADSATDYGIIIEGTSDQGHLIYSNDYSIQVSKED